MRWVTVDAQPAPGGGIIVFVTGESSVPVRAGLWTCGA